MSGTPGGARHEPSSMAAVSPETPGGDPVANLPYTPNFELGLQPLLASQALPAAGAFVAGTATLALGTKRVTFWVTYDRGAAGGFPVIRISTRATAAQSFHRVLIMDLSSFLATAPEGEINVYLEGLLGPAPATDDPIRYDVTVVLPANASEFQFEIAERGVTATPGTVVVGWTGDG